ncbi:imidazole glycerol phosphate synthase subunit HisF, partial [Pseudomonas syringae]
MWPKLRRSATASTAEQLEIDPVALAKRISPCRDADNGRVVKGAQIGNMRDGGDLVDHASAYDDHGADAIPSRE